MQGLPPDQPPQKPVCGSGLSLKSTILELHHWIGASLQRKLVMAIGTMLVLVSLGFLVILSGVYQNSLINEHTRASMQINRLLQASLENAMLKRDIPGLKAILRDMGNQPSIAQIMILNPEYEVRFSSDPSRINTMLKEDVTTRALTSISRQSRYLQSAQFGEVLRSVNPVRNQQPCSVCHGEIASHPVNGLLVVDYNAQSIQQGATNSALTLGVLGLLVILVVCLGIWLALVRLVLRPLNAVEQATHALANGEFDTVVKTHGHDQIARLGHSFNQMSIHLQTAMAKHQQVEDFLQALIDAIPDGIRVVDAEFNIIKANRAYCDQVGQSMAQVLEAKCYASSHGRDTQCPHTMVNCPVVETCLNGNVRLTTQDKHTDADGNDIYVEVSSACVDMVVNGETMPCVVESIRNLDEQAKISQQQRLSEIGLLAAGVAHEIYNPLSSIDLGLTALQSDMVAKKGSNSLEYFDMIRSEIQNCIKITDSLLLLSAPSGDANTLISLTQILPEILSLLRYEAQQRQVKMVYNFPDQVRILASDSDIRMLLVNLTMNAIHAMPNGGMVTISAYRDNGESVLEVADQGVGIAPKDLSSIFMPFWSRRADTSTGRGLGLSIVKAILERNNAKISVKSKLGKGSTFTVRFADADREE